MSEENRLGKAKEIYDKICEGLSEAGWNFKGDEEQLVIECGAKGEDLPMTFYINVDAKRSFVMFASPMSFEIKTDKRIDVALAVCMVNEVLANGCFTIDLGDGTIVFKMVNSFEGIESEKEAYISLLLSACHIIDDFNDKFLMLAKGMITLDNFFGSIG